jgi:hypothetical protein
MRTASPAESRPYSSTGSDGSYRSSRPQTLPTTVFTGHNLTNPAKVRGHRTGRLPREKHWLTSFSALPLSGWCPPIAPAAGWRGRWASSCPAGRANQSDHVMLRSDRGITWTSTQSAAPTPTLGRAASTPTGFGAHDVTDRHRPGRHDGMSPTGGSEPAIPRQSCMSDPPRRLSTPGQRPPLLAAHAESHDHSPECDVG